MVYTLAAYTITLGSLGLYLVLLQHRARQLGAAAVGGSAAAAGSDGTAGADAARGFNVGALLLAPIWMLRHGLALPGALLLVPCVAIGPLLARELWIPLLFVGAVPLAAGAALGFVGNRIAAAHTGIRDAGRLSASQLPWAVAGVVLHVFVLPWVVYLLID